MTQFEFYVQQNYAE